jgi:hypothetical protein
VRGDRRKEVGDARTENDGYEKKYDGYSKEGNPWVDELSIYKV